MCCCDDAEHDLDDVAGAGADADGDRNDDNDDVAGMLKESRDDKTSGLSEMFSSLILSTLR